MDAGERPTKAGAAMNTSALRVGVLALVAGLAVAPAGAQSEDQASEPVPAEPSSPAPSNVPPPPPTETPGPPTNQPPPAVHAAPQGQWVYTEQYGWVWMPYGNSYTYVPTDGSAPNMYVYYPAVGWSWVVA